MTPLKIAICVPRDKGMPPYAQCAGCLRQAWAIASGNRPIQHPPALVGGECPSRLEINATAGNSEGEIA